MSTLVRSRCQQNQWFLNHFYYNPYYLTILKAPLIWEPSNPHNSNRSPHDVVAGKYDRNDHDCWLATGQSIWRGTTAKTYNIRASISLLHMDHTHTS